MIFFIKSSFDLSCSSDEDDDDLFKSALGPAASKTDTAETGDVVPTKEDESGYDSVVKTNPDQEVNR